MTVLCNFRWSIGRLLLAYVYGVGTFWPSVGTKTKSTDLSRAVEQFKKNKGELSTIWRVFEPAFNYLNNYFDQYINQKNKARPYWDIEMYVIF
jgi:hypothetical protein